MTAAAHVHEQARRLIARRTGLHFPERRAEQLDRELARACRQAGGRDDVGSYVAMLERLPVEAGEWTRLVGQLTVGETYFFRDHTFEVLERVVLPQMIERRERAGKRLLRLWSAGCATGEEPYSVAMLVHRLLGGRTDWSVTILGTDVDPARLAAARRGVYRTWSLRQTPPWARTHHFRARRDGTFELDPHIRSMVTFATLNLVEGDYPSPATNTTAMDLVLCRNVLMYLTPEACGHAIGRLTEALADGGLIAVTPAEASPELMRPLAFEQIQGAVFFRRTRTAPTPAPCRPPSAMPPPRPARAVTKARTPTTALPAVRLDDALATARAQASCGELDAARATCVAAIQRDRSVPHAHLLLAAIAQEQRDVPGALQAARRAIYLAPHLPAAHFLLGTLLMSEGEIERGKQTMAGVVRSLGDTPPDELVPGTDGIAAGQLRAAARTLLEVR